VSKKPFIFVFLLFRTG